MQTEVSISSKKFAKSSLWLVLLFLLIAAGGLYYVKWSPYYEKAFVAAAKHDIGASILTGKANAAAPPSWQAAWEYAKTYFLAVWKAALLGVVLGSLVQVLIPRDWLIRVLGSRSFRSTAVAGAAALPGMMCTCCAAPIAVGLRKRFASIGAALAFWLGNPVLNPATIVFMGFVLSWKFAILRIFFGILLVFGVGYLADRFLKEEEVKSDLLDMPNVLSPAQSSERLGIRWIRSLWSLFWSVIPVYIIAVLALGAFRAWLFPAVDVSWGNSVWAMILLAITGTLFVIPTAAEIPIVKTMMSYGLGAGPAATLMMTLPAISLPSLIMVRKVFPAKVLWFVTGMVILIGILAGFAAMI